MYILYATVSCENTLIFNLKTVSWFNQTQF